VIVNQGGDLLEYNGELSHGDSIMLVAEFNLPSPEERAARRQELAEELRAAGLEVPEVDETISEVEEQRQADIAAAEQERLAEIEAAREQEMLESREAAQRAMSELRARLEREGASSSDVQVSLMWNNYNDLDLQLKLANLLKTSSGKMEKHLLESIRSMCTITKSTTSAGVRTLPNSK